MSKNQIIDVPASKQRDIGTIMTEIRTISAQAQRMILSYAIEIGRRLCEAKSMVPHGDWGRYLQEEVEFSRSSANNFMRIFEEYGAQQQSLFGAEANCQTFGNLTYSQALKLLAIPAEEREEFAVENHVEDMSARELEKLIKERDAARKAQEEAEIKAKAAEANAAREKKRADKMSGQLTAWQNDAATARAELKAAKENPVIPPETLQSLQADAEAKATQESARLRVELASARAALERSKKQSALYKPDVAAFQALFERVQQDINRMRGYLLRLEQSDPEVATKLRTAMCALGQAMQGDANG